MSLFAGCGLLARSRCMAKQRATQPDVSVLRTGPIVHVRESGATRWGMIVISCKGKAKTCVHSNKGCGGHLADCVPGRAVQLDHPASGPALPNRLRHNLQKPL